MHCAFDLQINILAFDSGRFLCSVLILQDNLLLRCKMNSSFNSCLRSILFVSMAQQASGLRSMSQCHYNVILPRGQNWALDPLILHNLADFQIRNKCCWSRSKILPFLVNLYAVQDHPAGSTGLGRNYPPCCFSIMVSSGPMYLHWKKSLT